MDYIFLLWFGSVLEWVYLSSKVEQKVTLFCMISILVLLTHIGAFSSIHPDLAASMASF